MHLKRLIKKGLICDGVHFGVHAELTFEKSSKIKGYFLTRFPEGREFESCHQHLKEGFTSFLFLCAARSAQERTPAPRACR